MRVSLVARNEGVSASLLFQWRKLKRRGALMGCAPIQKTPGRRLFISDLSRVGPPLRKGTRDFENQALSFTLANSLLERATRGAHALSQHKTLISTSSGRLR